MKIYEQKEVTRKEHVLIDTKCDLCSNSILDKTKWPNYDGHEEHDKNEVTLSHRKVDYYGSYDPGGSSESIEIDCCPSCWEEMILPHLRLLGLKIQYENDYW